MKLRSCFPALLSLVLTMLLTLPAAAQGKAPGGGGGTRGTGPTPRPIPNTTAPTSLSFPSVVFLSGKVVVDDGSRLTEPASVQTVCRGQKHTEAHTDSHGGFSFQIGGQAPAVSADAISDADNSSNSRQGRALQRDYRDCQLQAELAGFRSETIELSSRLSSMEGIDIGRIVLHRLADVQGFTISATTAAAPDKARKSYDKGMDQEKKEKWDDAHESLSKAVEIYPKYAVAWLELGRVNLHRKDATAARDAFQHSLDADPGFVSPYEELAVMAAHDKDWTQVVNLTTRLLSLNPHLPQAWFLNSAAQYNLQKIPEAEKSVREGLRLDEEHRIPRLEYLMANILIQKQEYQQATQHMRAYLELAPNAPDAAAVRAQLADLERQASAAVAPAPPK
jgi:tetratricopeptide (TPR) repeat protein